ncbi:hypothetical protein [Chelativorans xinjiangense]|uniref:hypothetical protein n=1 Tax=Chelativorans xinjiangense TaxID=2681485 RepID=UPI001357D952|nr:hypothetical protein [Chelativorans xinjiangense]
MMQLFLSIAAHLRRRMEQFQVIENYADEERWHRDPLSHPDIARMSPGELADLPLQRKTGVCER